MNKINLYFMQTIVIAGASGFIGKQLSLYLKHQRYIIVKINRNQLYGDTTSLANLIESSYAVINLSGAGILRRWNKKNKELILSSRVQSTNNLIQAINHCTCKPQMLINTSAVGIYDTNHTHTEQSKAFGNDFLADVCQQWEAALDNLSQQVRRIIFRLGVVLHPEGGVLRKMKLPFKLAIGGNLGNGQQAFPFIAMPDLLKAYKFCLKNKQITGVVNLVSPQLLTNAEFTKAFAKTLHRPAFLSIPKWLLQMVFGKAHVVLSSGQKVVPEKLLQLGFKFKYANLSEYLKTLF